ncbi:outer membrane lipoprotein-sorting protein [Pseudoduganella namucuonensis]|uniref:Outer membrane lipoprotein-sorting protein n=1 Tax=Pseudoduganella namucuonensis TaxID=1035707 RepID=A0A1I7GXC0_9BURK|nr:outer membrane lipoprotein-sorting protein [Pseudoduganella namucuonensis]SFU53114.1 outer membrane lipoprotein-sorting protein [Pseudoduganella namucuonensis]
MENWKRKRGTAGPAGWRGAPTAWALAVALAWSPAAPAGAAAPAALELLRAADEARGNVEGIAWNVTVETSENERVTDTLVYEIKARGFNVAGVSQAPPKYKGNKLLMLNTSMWFYKQGLSKPVPVSQRQKLMGDASYGDIASTNYAEHYDAAELPEEDVDGEACRVFDLKARTDKVTYDRIRYWISTRRQVGVKAEYYTVSGKKFKTATMDYDNEVRLGGRKRPFLSRIVMRGELMNGAVTRLSLREPHIGPLPDHVFDLNLFMR